MKKYYDVVVVGGGPTGGYVAGKISSKGYNVAIFEQKKEIGEPLNCAGLISSRVFDITKLRRKCLIQNKIKGAHIYSPSNNILTIGGDKTHAIVINRTLFDKEIIKTAVNNGSNIFLKNKILSAKKIVNHIEIRTNHNKHIKCKILIGADGPYSKIRNIFDFPRPKEFIKGIGAEISNIKINPNYVEIFLGSKVAPGFFAWVIPTNSQGTTARIGLCINQNAPYPPIHYFSYFIKNKIGCSNIDGFDIIKKIGGIIPLGFFKKTYDSNVLLVGDAAAQVKPTSGGGIYTGLLCAKHCSKVSIDALEKNNFNSNTLKRYQKLWSKDIGKEIFIGMILRKIFKKLTDVQLDFLINKFQKEELNKLITKYGDIDYPSKLAKQIIKKSPWLFNFLPKIKD